MSIDFKYFLEKNVRLTNGEVTVIKQAYDTVKAAEISYHNEVAYGLALDNVLLAHYEVVDEFGNTVDNLVKDINNIPQDEVTAE